MIGWLALALLQQPLAGTPASAWGTLCLRDAVTAAPVMGARVREEARAASRRLSGACTRVSRRADSTTVAVSRVGYAPQTVIVPPSGAADTLWIALVPQSVSPTTARLPAQRVVADAAPPGAAGQAVASLTSAEAQLRGATTVNGLLALLPYTNLRSARGETGLSLRGARREQVVITLDGLPLNDPATGVADVSDLPLLSVQSATITPGADPIGAGSGASGGVLALSTATQRAIAVRTGAFGARAAEGTWTGTPGGVRLHATSAWREARNDFAFVNNAGVSPVAETRVNNDERRAVVSAGLTAATAQWSLLASAGERGMVGPANVRAYDADRARTARVILRGEQALGRSVLTTGSRWFTLAYRDPARPALDSRASAWAADLEWRRSLAGGVWRAGGGADGLRATGNITQQRARGFAAYGWQRARTAARRLDADVGVRTDVIEGAGVMPTASAGVTWRPVGTRHGSHLLFVSRAAQAVRVPTLYDLYFSAPQRLFVRALAPERVRLDASAGAQFTLARPAWRGFAEAILVHRDTRDAIVWFPGNFGWSPANVGRERVQGVESRLAIQTAVASFSAWSTVYDAQLTTGGLQIPTPYVPRVSGGVQVLVRRGAVVLSGNARVQGPRPFTAGPRDPAFELPAVSLVDVALARTIVAGPVGLLASIGVDNLSNARWESVRGFPMPGRAWSLALTLQPRR